MKVLTKLRTRIVCGEHLSKLSRMMHFNRIYSYFKTY